MSEIVSNAVEHGGTDITVRVRRRGAVIRVEVEDDGPGWPVLVPSDPLTITGRGLRILDETHAVLGRGSCAADGKTVWAELAG